MYLTEGLKLFNYIMMEFVKGIKILITIQLHVWFKSWTFSVN